METFMNLSSLDDVLKAYDNLYNAEKQIERDLSELYDKHHELESQMKSIKKNIPDMQLLESDASQLASMINFTSTLADNVSAKVRRLDLVKTRATQCVARVNDILDLKFCTEGIQKALTTEDYEQAAAHIHRFLSMDESVLKKSVLENELEENEGNVNVKNEVNMSASAMEEAFAKLHEAEAKLKTIVMKRFDEAVRDDDHASVERFFKIFPLLNQHEEGLKKFTIYLCTKISDKALVKNVGSTNATHTDKLTQLYESIAKMIDIHQPLVETYYGPGKLIFVIEILQKECDRQSKRIYDDFKSKKNLSQIWSIVVKLLKPSSSFQTTQNKIDPREIDQLLSEIIFLNARSQMYLRFVTKRARNDLDVGFPESGTTGSNKEERLSKLGQIEMLMRNCELSVLMHEMNGIYVLMEEYFMKESANKAVTLDSIDSTGSLTSSMLDDIFFIMKKCIKRALSGGNVDVMCAVINHSVSLLESSFCDTLNERLRHGYPSTATISGAAAALDLSQAYSAIQTAGSRYLQSSSDIEKAKTMFLTSLNNLDTSCEYVKTLKNNLSEDIKKSFGTNQTQHQQNEKLESCLSDLVSLTGKFKSIITSGLGQLCSTALKPRIKTWIEAFLASNHVLTEDDITSCEATDGLRPFTHTFIIGIDVLMKLFKDSLTQNNFDTLLSLFSTELTKRLGDALFKCQYNKLGGFQFDRELRAIINYLTTATTWSIRDKFSKLKHIALILNLESVDEINEYFKPNSDGVMINPLLLTPNEVRKVLRLRNDFGSLDQIKISM